jgi:ATP-binding cassette subfamily F protein 3
MVCDRLWLVDGGSCKTWDGDLDEYRTLLLDKQRSKARSERSLTAETPKSRKQVRQDRAKARVKTANIRKLAQEAEKLVEQLEQKKADLEAQLADPEVYEGSTTVLKEFQIEADNVKLKLAEAEEAWLKAQTKIESIK